MKQLSGGKKPNTRISGRAAALICRVIGIILTAAVVGSLVAITLPMAFEYDIYSIVSGSMKPYIPVGSAVYLHDTDPLYLKEGEVAAFMMGESIIIHRVKQNNPAEAYITTIGDANEADDGKIRYENVFGKVAAVIPLLGVVMILVQNGYGIFVLALLLAIGLWLIWCSRRFEFSEK